MTKSYNPSSLRTGGGEAADQLSRLQSTLLCTTTRSSLNQQEMSRNFKHIKASISPLVASRTFNRPQNLTLPVRQRLKSLNTTSVAVGVVSNDQQMESIKLSGGADRPDNIIIRAIVKTRNDESYHTGRRPTEELIQELVRRPSSLI